MYRTSFLIGLIIFIISYVLQFIFGGVEIPAFPFNFLLLIIYSLALSLMYYFDKDKAYMRWLGSVPATMVALVLVLIQSLLMGFFLQSDSSDFDLLGIHHVKQSQAFLVSILFLQTCLTIVLLKRMFPLKKTNLMFILNHLGLWLLITSIGLGTGDLKRFDLKLQKNHPIGEGHWGFSLDLKDFIVENYTPKCAFVNLTEGKVIEKTIIEAKPFSKTNYLDYEVEILEYIEDAEYNEQAYMPANSNNSAPAAYLRLGSPQRETNAWISCGSNSVLPMRADFNSTIGFVMFQPEPGKFESHLEINTSKGKREAVVAVNKPFSVEGWKIYQKSYDKEKGKYSDTSIVELIYDPWDPITKLGIVMLILGSIGLIIQRRPK